MGKCSGKLNHKRGSSGGVLVLIKNDVIECFTELHPKFQHGPSFLATSNEKLKWSGVYNICSVEDNGIVLLESYINQVELKYPNIDLLVNWYCNARTKDSTYYIIDDSTEYIPFPNDYEEDRFSMPRNSKVLHRAVNIQGKSLLNYAVLMIST